LVKANYEEKEYSKEDIYKALTEITKVTLEQQKGELIINRFGFYVFTEFPYLVPKMNENDDFDKEIRE